jgi:hypothetical protein
MFLFDIRCGFAFAFLFLSLTQKHTKKKEREERPFFQKKIAEKYVIDVIQESSERQHAQEKTTSKTKRF